MIETIIKSNTARIVQLEGDVRSLAVTLERVSTEQKHQTELLQTIQLLLTTKTREPASLALSELPVVKFTATLLSIEELKALAVTGFEARPKA